MNLRGAERAMLEHLDEVNWRSLTHAYGTAEDVPVLLRRLAAGNAEEQRNVIYEFFGNIWHQGTVYEASAHAVPFLIEILNAPSIGCRPDILHLLQALASGSSYHDVHQSLESYQGQRQTPEFQGKVQRELTWVVAAHRAVVDGVPSYLRLLDDADPSTRSMVPYLLATCIERAAEIESSIRARVAVEPDASVKAIMVLGLGKLWQRSRHQAGQPAILSPDLATLMTELMGSNHPPVVRLAAALARVECSEAALDPIVYPVIRETLPASIDAMRDTPWFEGEPLRGVIESLAHQPHLQLRLLFDLLGTGDAEMAAAAVYQLQEVCRERRSPRQQAARAFGELLKSEDVKRRQVAASALSQVGSSASVAADDLVKSLDDRDPDVRKNSAIALSKTGDRRAIPPLIKLLTELKSHPHILDALKRFGPAARPAVPELRRLLRATKGQDRLRVALVLGEIGPEARAALPELIAALGDPGAATGVAWALSQWGPDAWEAVSDLTMLLDADDHTRGNAARALGRIGPAAEAAVLPLTKLLRYRDLAVRAQAAMALWRIKEKFAEEAVETLMAIASEARSQRKQDAQFGCQTAVEYLGEIGPAARPAIPLLQELLGHNSHWIRIHAACGLWRIEGATDMVLPVLLTEIRCRPAGLLVLKHLADMGSHAKEAIPLLQQLLDSDATPSLLGSTDSWIDEEEKFLSEARVTLARIQSAS
jgi:HEAT repeat protein